MKPAFRKVAARTSIIVVSIGAIIAVPTVAGATATGVSGASGVTTTTAANPASKSAKGASDSSGAAAASISAREVKLEAEATARQAQLVKLTAEVTGSATLTTSDHTTLTSRLATRTASVAAIVTHIPTDTTSAELQADSAALIKDNRVFAVMTPQVNLTNQIDAQLAKLTTFSTKLSGLGGNPASISTLISNTSSALMTAHSSELAQTPTGYPTNEPVFTQARQAVVHATAQIKEIATEERRLTKKAAKS